MNRPIRVRLVSVHPPCLNCGQPVYDPDAELCVDCLFYRRVMFQRFRYEAGDLTEFPDDLPPLREALVTPVGHGSLDDWSADSIALAVSGPDTDQANA